METLHKCSSSDNVKIEVLGSNGDENVKVREYINSAVYVETSCDISNCKTPIFMNIPGSGDHPKIVKVKRCLCFTNPRDCPCHPYDNEAPVIIQDHKYRRLARTAFTNSSPTLLNNLNSRPASSSTNFKSDSGSTLKPTETIAAEDDLHLSIPSLTLSPMNTVRCIDDLTKEENFKSWCMKKDQERKLQEQKLALTEEIKKKQRERQLEVERENFKHWLAIKKKEEEIKKKLLDQKMREERDKHEIEERRLQENHLSFQLWVKKKEEQILEKKIKEHMKIIKMEEEKQKRLEYSAQAYDIWLQQSKNKPKPLPPSRGLESLKSSVSVTYINPKPWVPNIDVQKPTSQ